MTEWQEIPLGDVLGVKHGFAFKGEFFASAGASVLLTPKNFRAEGGLDVSPGRCKYYDGPVDNTFVLEPGSVVVAMTDLKQDAPILGAAGIIPASGRYLHNQRIGKVIVRDPDRLDPAFVPWLLNSPTVRARIRATATGSTVRHSAPRRIAETVTAIPTRRTQRRIAAILSACDELIDINERRIELLEELARSLYREWFVRFRFSGHQGTELVDTAIGLVPRGWQVQHLGAVCSMIRAGKTPRRSDPTNWDGGTVNWFKTGELRDGPLTNSAERVVAKPNLRLFDPPMIFMAIYGSPTVGRLGWVTQTCSCNQAALALRANGPADAQDWLWFQLQSLRAHFNSLSQGAAQQNISKEKVVETLVAVPPAPLLTEFAEHAGPWRRLSHEVRLANERLAATRDLLLPRLVTGRLDISDVDLGDLRPAEVA